MEEATLKIIVPGHSEGDLLADGLRDLTNGRSMETEGTTDIATMLRDCMDSLRAAHP